MTENPTTNPADLQPKAAKLDYITLLIIGLFTAIALPLLFKLNIWMDEAYTLDTTSKDFLYALMQALEFELQPPLYFLVMWLWRGVTDSIIWARLFSLLCVVLMLFNVAALSRRWFEKIHPAWIVAAIAFNPLTFYAAFEIRRYALTLLLSSTLLLLFNEGFLREVTKRRAQILFSIIAVFALYTQYFLGFMLFAGACALFVNRKWESLIHYIVCMIITGLFFLPMLLYLPNQVSGHEVASEVGITLKKQIIFVLWRVVEYGLSTEWIGEPHLWKVRKIFFLVMLVALGIAGWKKRSQIIRPQIISIFVLTAIIAIFFVGVIGMLDRLLLTTHHTAVLFLPAMLVFFSIVATFEKKSALAAWLTIVLLFNTMALVQTYKPMAKRGDYQNAANYIAEKEQENQPILVFLSENEIALKQYYKGKNKMLPLPYAEDFEHYDIRQFALSSEEEIIKALSSVGDYKSIWVYRDYRVPCKYLGVPLNCDILDNYLEKNFELIKEKQFFDATVGQYKIKPAQ